MSASKRCYTNQVNTGAVEFFSHNLKNFLQPYGKAYIQLNDRIIKHGLAYSTFSNSSYQNFEDIQDKITPRELSLGKVRFINVVLVKMYSNLTNEEIK